MVLKRGIRKGAGKGLKSRSSRLFRYRDNYGYFFILPLILGVALIFIPNLITTFRFSVSNITLVTEGYTTRYQGWEYYKNALTVDAYFIPYLIANLKIFATDVPVITIFSLFIASLLNGRFHGRGLARMIFFVPVILATGIISTVENVTGIMNIVEQGRALNTGIESSAALEISSLLTQIDFPQTLMKIIQTAISSIYSIVQSSGMQIFILLAGLQEISGTLYDAAKVEGCNQWELFWKITFPMIGPQIRVAIIYTIVDLYTSDKSNLVEYVNRLAFRQNQFALGTAMYVVYLLTLAAMIAIVLFVLHHFVKYTEEG
ncbi:MAG: carbohydrate ABC transporter permease [Saccharofermentanales bacterium]